MHIGYTCVSSIHFFNILLSGKNNIDSKLLFKCYLYFIMSYIFNKMQLYLKHIQCLHNLWKKIVLQEFIIFLFLTRPSFGILCRLMVF